MEFKQLQIKGMVFNNVEQIRDWGIVFTNEEGEKYALAHEQECCEEVYIESVDGDLQDLVGQQLLMAEEAHEKTDVETYTFYKLATVKGYVTVRFYGASNGYYSEEAHLYAMDEEGWLVDLLD